jgi:hypothetical protein
MGTPTAASNPARDLLTRNWAKKVAQKLQSLLPNKPNEADLRHGIEPLFDGFCVEAGIPPLAHAEFSLASGTADAVFSRFTIEYKRMAELSMQAHELAKTPARDKPQASSRKLEEVEAEVDLESAQLWNLTASDLAEIQRSLKELTE